MKQILLVFFLLTAVIGGLWYVNGNAFVIGLGIIVLTTVLCGVFFLGSQWTLHVIKTSVEVFIKNLVVSNNRSDTVNVRLQEPQAGTMMKQNNTALPSFPTGYPALRPFNAVDGIFTITGLDDEEKAPHEA